MRRKIEYLLRNSALHPEGCHQEDGLGEVRVVNVFRIENRSLWRNCEDTWSTHSLCLDTCLYSSTVHA